MPPEVLKVNRPPQAFRHGRSMPRDRLRPLALAIERGGSALIVIPAPETLVAIRRVLRAAARPARSPSGSAMPTNGSTWNIESDLIAVLQSTRLLSH
jgi:hypothetical protein